MKHNKTATEKESVLNEKLKLLRGVSMTEQEKDRMSFFLSNYVGLHPVMGEQERVLRERKKRYSVFSATFRQFTPAFITLVFFVWGGVALAGTSLPGGALYAVKTTSEDIRESLSFNTEQTARFEAERINRRLNEAHQLLERGSVSEKSVRVLAHELKTSFEDLQGLLDTLEGEGKYLLVFEIEKAHSASVSTYEDIFVKMSEDNEHVKNFLASMAVHFGLNEGYFALAGEINSLALQADVAGDMEMRTFSVAGEEQDMSAFGAETEDSDDSQTDGPEGVREQFDVEMMRISDAEESPELGSSLDLGTLELYVSVRIAETNEQIENARKLDPRLRDAFLSRLERARTLYTSGVSSGATSDDNASRSFYLESISIVEDIQPLLRMATNKPSELFIGSILRKLEGGDIPGRVDPRVLLEEEEVRGLRETSGEDLREESVEGGEPLQNEGSEESAEAAGGELDLRGVQELIEGIEL